MPHQPQTSTPMTKKITHPRQGPAHKLRQMGRWVGGSIGQMEALAGIDIQSSVERKALWDKFSHLYRGETQALIDAVMDHCATIALKRIQRGELSLIPAMQIR